MRPNPPFDTSKAPAGVPDISKMRAELHHVQTRLARLDSDLAQLDRSEPTTSARPRAARYYQLLLDVYEHGRYGVGTDQFGQLGAVHHYDRRGLGGFFAGRRAPLRMAHERVRLTPEGERVLERHLLDQKK